MNMLVLTILNNARVWNGPRQTIIAVGTECIVTVPNILLLTLTFVMIQYLLFKLKQCVYC